MAFIVPELRVSGIETDSTAMLAIALDTTPIKRLRGEQSSDGSKFSQITEICQEFLKKNEIIGEYLDAEPYEKLVRGDYTEIWELYILYREWVTKLSPAFTNEETGLAARVRAVNTVMVDVFAQFDRINSESQSILEIRDKITSGVNRLIRSCEEVIRFTEEYIRRTQEQETDCNSGEIIIWRDKAMELEKTIRLKSNPHIEITPPSPIKYSANPNPFYDIREDSFFKATPVDPEMQAKHMESAQNAAMAWMYARYLESVVNIEQLDQIINSLYEYLYCWFSRFFKRILSEYKDGKGG